MTSKGYCKVGQHRVLRQQDKDLSTLRNINVTYEVQAT